MCWRARFCDNYVPFSVVVELDGLAREGNEFSSF